MASIKCELSLDEQFYLLSFSKNALILLSVAFSVLVISNRSDFFLVLCNLAFCSDDYMQEHIAGSKIGGSWRSSTRNPWCDFLNSLLRTALWIPFVFSHEPLCVFVNFEHPLLFWMQGSNGREKFIIVCTGTHFSFILEIWSSDNLGVGFTFPVTLLLFH